MPKTFFSWPQMAQYRFLGALNRYCAQRTKLLSVFALALSPSLLSAQVSAPTVALNALEQAALLAFNPNGKTFNSITFDGSVTWVQGSLRDAGTVTLKAVTDGSTAETWNLGTVPYGYTSTSFSAGRSCTNTNGKGVAQADESPACLRAIPWFAPGYSSLFLTNSLLDRTTTTNVSAPGVSSQQATYTTTLNTPPSASASQVSQVVSQTATRISYDPVTYLPSQEDFDYALSSDPARNIQYRVVFSDYRPEQGLVVPHRIQRYLQRTLQADITITSVTIE